MSYCYVICHGWLLFTGGLYFSEEMWKKGWEVGVGGGLRGETAARIYK